MSGKPTARPIWRGAIAFGLVHVPVELYPAENRREFQFSMLDKRDFSPVGYKRYSKKSGAEVPWEDVVKAYEYEKGQYVVLSDEDFRRANVKASQAIDVKSFVPAAEIPPQFFDTPYYLVPTGRGGEKVYALLRETLRTTNRWAIGEVVIRTTQRLAAVAPSGRLLMLITLRYPDELRGVAGLALPAENLKRAGVSAKEVELAKRLVEGMAAHWKPSEFHNTYHKDLLRRINEKIKAGQTKVITKAAGDEQVKPSADVIDLAALLRRSLGKARGPATVAHAPAKRRAAGRQPLRAVARVSERGVAARRKRA
jgi:DNA end-binding protein Ku